MREIITICVGGAGVRIGAKFWELLWLEHGIAPNGRPNQAFHVIPVTPVADFLMRRRLAN